MNVAKREEREGDSESVYKKNQGRERGNKDTERGETGEEKVREEEEEEK